jgi:DNA invertase Pin-like site-specific DNA recombinase
MTTRVLGFCRISVDTDASTSITKQEEAIRAYCKAHGWELVHLATSPSISGATAPRDHESLKEWLTDSPPKQWDVLLSNTLDRISRSTRDTLELVHDLDKQGRSLRTIKDNVDSSGAHGRLMLTILSAVAEAERMYTAERLADTRKLLRRGGWHQAGRPPYGYTKVKVARADGKFGYRWAINPSEQAVILRAASSAIEGKSVQDICRELIKDRVPGPGGKTWHAATLLRTLKGEQLLGHGYHKGEVVHELGKPVIFGDPLLDRTTFDRLQVSLSDNGKPHAKAHARSLLYGLIHCADCERPMVGSGRGKRESYVCRTKTCPNGAILRRIAEEYVDEHFRKNFHAMGFVPGHWSAGPSAQALESQRTELRASSARLMADRQAGLYDEPELERIFLDTQTRYLAQIRELTAQIEAHTEAREFVPTGEPSSMVDLWEATESTEERRELLMVARYRIRVRSRQTADEPQDRLEIVPAQFSGSIKAVPGMDYVGVYDAGVTSARGALCIWGNRLPVLESVTFGDVTIPAAELEGMTEDEFKKRIQGK